MKRSCLVYLLESGLRSQATFKLLGGRIGSSRNLAVYCVYT